LVLEWNFARTGTFAKEVQMKMLQKLLLNVVTLLGISSIFGCASVAPKIYEADKLRSIKSWQLEFAYESGEIEELKKSSGDAEIKVVNKGQSPRDLQLRDDIFYTLKDEYSISLVKEAGESTGKITIHPIHFYSGGFKLLTVTFLDTAGDTLARMKITNGDQQVTFMDDDGFARYVAKAIAQTLKEKL
jgi:hypothetical protein